MTLSPHTADSADTARSAQTGHTALVAAVVSAALLWGAVTGVRLLAGLGISLALASLLRRRLTPVSAPVQGLLLLASGLVALFLTALLSFSPEVAWGDRPVHRAWAVLGSGALLLAAVRTHLREPEGGVVATMGLGLICLMACGSVLSGPLYLGAALVYLPLMFIAVRCADLHRPRWLELGWRHRFVLSGTACATALMTASLLVALPAAYDRASAWALGLLGDSLQAGFHDGPMALGSLRGMLQSDEIVLRVQGEVGDRLRGNVYTHYANAYWLANGLANQPAEAKLEVVADRLAAGHHAEANSPSPSAIIRHAKGEGDRFFLPLDASLVELSPSRVRIDRYGIARPADEKAPVQARLRLGSLRRLAPAPPHPEDSQLPDTLRPQLEAIATSWTGDATTARERVQALQAHLEADYSYSLEFERGRASASSDAILQFLLEDRQGHCEYFASALALLARASGLPSRMVTGYRVQERNPWGDYYVVRERHAHAWVEIHLGESGWVAFDPSPLQSFEDPAVATTPLASALWDWVGVEVRRRGPAPYLVLLVVVFGGIQLRRLWRGRRRRAGREEQRPSSPPFVAELLSQLGRSGWRRSQGETLEAFARRLQGADTGSPSSSPSRSSNPHPNSNANPHRHPPSAVLGSRDSSPAESPASASLAGAQRLLVRVAALLYGGRGDSRALERDVRDWIAQGS